MLQIIKTHIQYLVKYMTTFKPYKSESIKNLHGPLTKS